MHPNTISHCAMARITSGFQNLRQADHFRSEFGAVDGIAEHIDLEALVTHIPGIVEFNR